MATVLTPPPPQAAPSPFHRFSVADYHRMIAAGILDDTHRVELLDGYVVTKMPRNPPHASAIQGLQKRLFRLLPAGWDVRIQCAITLTASEPEPDLTVVRGDETVYRAHHPGPGEVGLVVEVADSSLDRDRAEKGRIYAHGGIPVYWVVNLVERQVEVYTAPTPAAGYSQRQDLLPGDSVSVVLDGATVATLPVNELLP